VPGGGFVLKYGRGWKKVFGDEVCDDLVEQSL